ncbi:MAG: hypothetical protein M1826_006724 [Phylliscum demangeonii]|nr:MAG: hypothetical protein M1826_006724 [Phylliscum demangeonii]
MLSIVLLLYASLTVAWPTARTAAAGSPVRSVDHLMELPPPTAAQRQHDYQLLDRLRLTGFFKAEKIDQYLVTVFERGKAVGFRQQAPVPHAAPAPGQEAAAAVPAAAQMANSHRSLQRRAEPPGEGGEPIGGGAAGGEGRMYDEVTVAKIFEFARAAGMALKAKLVKLEANGIDLDDLTPDAFFKLEDQANKHIQDLWRRTYAEEPPPLPPLEVRRAVQKSNIRPPPDQPPPRRPGTGNRGGGFGGGGNNGNSNNFSPAGADLLPAWMHTGAGHGPGPGLPAALVHRLQTTAAHLQQPFPSSSKSLAALERWWAQASRRAKTAAKADAPFVLPAGEF